MAPAVGDAAAPLGPKEIHQKKLEAMRRSGARSLPSNVEWVRSLPPTTGGPYDRAIRRRPTRTLSGVAVVAVMTAPARCPHGRCSYCPGGVENGAPQSYTGEEPSALRGAQFHYDARSITTHRLEALEAIGHPTSKVEVIVMGGTFPSRPRRYQEEVFRGVFDGLNGETSSSLTEAQERNEASRHRLVGLTVETRPDWCDERVLPFLLDAGVTRVEIGVECLNEAVLLAVGRAHDTGAVVRATALARGQGLKVCYHMMLGLPGMTPAEDLAGFGRLFADHRYRPDMLKIYPTLVLPGTSLFDDWQAGRYHPYDTETAVEVLAGIKRNLPPWVRIQRIQRDIPARLIAAGVRTSNVRELALARLRSEGTLCRCLRCREVGRRGTPSPESLELQETTYEAAPGREVFLSWTDPASEAVAGFLRLSLPAGGTASPIIRELKVLGMELPVGASPARTGDYQHRGLGRALVARAEQAAHSAGFDELRVISAVGTRPYFRSLGYERHGPYMARAL